MFVNFCKMQGLGNDFVVIDLITQNVKMHTGLIKKIADRHLGIGCDQVLLIEPPIQEDRDFFYRVFNADGFEVEQCGNGARCVARYFFDSGFTNRSYLKADCLSGPIDFQIDEDQNITVKLNPPEIKTQQELDITFDNQTIHYLPLSVGNPHAVIRVENIETAPVKNMGSYLARHPQFPNGTNVEFMEIINRNHIKLRVFERGVGETLACGSGACASVVAGFHLDLLEPIVNVDFHSNLGQLKIRYEGINQPIYMTGPAISVFVGRFRL